MSEKNTEGLLGVLVQQLKDGTYKKMCEQRDREIEFDRAQEALDNPAFTILSDPNTEH